jgi:hypothetical protein
MNGSAPLTLAQRKRVTVSGVLIKRTTLLPINIQPRFFVSHKHIALQLPQTQTNQISNFFISLK